MPGPTVSPIMPDKTRPILIVGLGLIGGSYARALARRGYTVHAIDTRQEAIDYALREGFIAAGSTQPDPQLIGGAPLAVFALYPHVFIEWIRQHQELFSPGTIITDVTGVKQAVVGPVQQLLRPDVEFIAAHPMAGREVYGVENSDDAIFRDANYIVVPTEKNTLRATMLCEALGRELGFAHISRLTPQQHDTLIGFVSQLTHVIAMALMTCSDNRHLVDYTGDSFRDLTRIARINDKMWSELFLLDRDALIEQIDIFTAEMHELRQIIAARDTEALRAKMRLSSERRAWFDKKEDD